MIDRTSTAIAGDDRTGRTDAAIARSGIAYGVAAYLSWGIVPIYFKAVASVPALELLAHRVAWSVPLLNLLLLFQGRWRAGLKTVWHRRTALTLIGSTTLIAVNWLTYIYSVSTGQVLYGSLGYFINPLVNVLLGYWVLREGLRRWQLLSVLLAASGVVFLTVSLGRLPWISLVLAVSFGLYGLLRKTMRADSLTGLTAETTLLSPLAVAYLVYAMTHGTASFRAGSWKIDVLVLSAGVVTAIPLLWFAVAAKRLTMATLGLLQYIAPSGQFLLAVLVYGESFTRSHMIAFACIWTALAGYSIEAYLHSRTMYPRGTEVGATGAIAVSGVARSPTQ